MDNKLYYFRLKYATIIFGKYEGLTMKKNYKKPNICKVDFEILDLILESGGENTGAEPDPEGWEFDSFGGYDGSDF